MRVSRSFSFDDKKDEELLKFIDGCRNRSDSIRLILRNALGFTEEQSAYKEIASTVKPITSAYQAIATTIRPVTSELQTGSEEPLQHNIESNVESNIQTNTEIDTEINAEIAVDTQKEKPPVTPVKGRVMGFDNVLAVLNGK